MSNRAHNFSAGPCILPLEVLKEAQQEFVDYQDTGMSLFEMSHRGTHFVEVANSAIAGAREVFEVPDDFAVLLLQGGATLQFSMVPMNLLHQGQKGAYVNSGSWARLSLADAAQHAAVYTAWDGADCGYSRMPSTAEIRIEDNTRYLHITSNETIDGVQFASLPEVGVPLVADMSSDYMTRPLPWEKIDIVYGGSQKNLGPAGLGVVFIRKSILDTTARNIGSYLRYDMHDAQGSLMNTPPVFAIYMFGKVMKWMKAQGGLPVMQRNAAEKSQMLYQVIDNSGGYYHSPVERASRSQMNVVFHLPSAELEQAFLTGAAERNITNLKGHRSVGGCRASIYNAMPKASVAILAEYMREFSNDRHQPQP